MDTNGATLAVAATDSAHISLHVRLTYRFLVAAFVLATVACGGAPDETNAAYEALLDGPRDYYVHYEFECAWPAR